MRGGYQDARPESGVGVEEVAALLCGKGKRWREEEEKQVPQSYRAGASKDSKGGGGGGRGWGGQTLVKLSTDA